MLAMQWVQRNIRFFNGDPSKVTIYGHSAGAGDAGLHMLSDLTKGIIILQERYHSIQKWRQDKRCVMKRLYKERS